jgi:DnaJ-class molecular chaperone
MTVTIKCLYCDGTGRDGRSTCPLCYGVAQQDIQVVSLDDIDDRSIVSVSL